MASTPSHDARKATSRARPGASAIQASSASPHTPLSRSISGLYGSPSASFRTDEENNIIIEVGTRFLRAGFAGDSAPRCTLAFDPEQHRRVGDYRQWMPDYEQWRQKGKRGTQWGEEHELWQMDATNMDLGLLEDRLDRMIREMESKYLMLDNRQKKVTIVAPSLLPRPLLSTLLATLFSTLQPQSVSLLPSSIMTSVGAGLRSALVVDIGWHACTVSAVFEYREVLQRRTSRAGKMLAEEWRVILNAKAQEEGMDNESQLQSGVSFRETEEVMNRLSWCQSRKKDPEADEEMVLRVPLFRPGLVQSLPIRFSELAEPVEKALIPDGSRVDEYDDDDLPIHHLIFNSLLQLPIDIRKSCMARIVFVGGVSQIPGLKGRILQELDNILTKRGWDPVKNYGSASGADGRPRAERTGNATHTKPKISLEEAHEIGVQPVWRDKPAPVRQYPLDPPKNNASPPKLTPQREQEPDPIAAKLASLRLKEMPAPIEGVIRGVESLGAWQGASLVTNLRVRGVVEIEKDKFLQQGIGGASFKKEISVVPQYNSRQSMGPGVKGGPGERSSWTLGIWA